MSERAFIKRIAGQWRIRIVRGGLDADNMALGTADVIFDSAAADSLPVLVRGSYQLGGDVTDTPFVTWADLGWIPFHVWTFSYGGTFSSVIALSSSQLFNVYARSWGLFVESAGISYPVTINYIVFRRPV